MLFVPLEAVFLSGRWVKAEAATDLTFFDLLVLISLLAFEATLFDVFSFLATFFLATFFLAMLIPFVF